MSEQLSGAGLDILSDSHEIKIVLGDSGDGSEFIQANRAWLDDELRLHGAILLRGFRVRDTADFDRIMRTLSPTQEVFLGGASPRTQLSETAFTSTDYPADFPIQFHCEYSYAYEWPMRLAFACLEPADSGGATPIADTRKVLASINPDIVAEFVARRIMYVRRYIPGLGVSWQQAFQTTDEDEVVRACRHLHIEVDWKDGTLIARQYSDPVLGHPETGERTWFNHAFFFNIHAFEPLEIRQALLTGGEESLAANTYYGDGGAIKPTIVEHLGDAYRQNAVEFDWQQGDVLLVDNMLMAHGRRPFAGRRRIVVGMATKIRRNEVEALGM